MKIYLTFNVAPAGAILHIMMKSARTFVHHFDMFLKGKLEAEDIYTFYWQHVSRFAVLIRSAEQWSSQMEELFQDMEDRYFQQVNSGEIPEPAFLKPTIEYNESLK